VLDAAFAPDGKTLLTGGDDHTARLVELETGKEIRVYRGHEAAVRAVAFAPDGRRLATGSADATVRFWDYASDKELKVFRKHADGVIAVSFADEGRKTLSVSRDAVVLQWVVQKPATSTPTPEVPVATGLDTTRPPKRVDGVSVGGTVAGLVLSPDRKYLYYLNITDTKLERIDTATGKRDQALDLWPGTEAIGLSPDGQNLVAIAPTNRGPNVRAGPPKPPGVMITVVDPVKLFWKNRFEIRVAAYDLAVADKGLIYLSGSDRCRLVSLLAAYQPRRQASLRRQSGSDAGHAGVAAPSGARQRQAGNHKSGGECAVPSGR
jgi:dipeptidyl aminopeptidase/acylaminoacyl peptidase